VLKELVEEDLKSVCILMLIVIASPSILTSIIYFYVLYLLKKNVSVVQPSKTRNPDIGKSENGAPVQAQPEEAPNIRNSPGNDWTDSFA
jgi:hypothetical protein